MFIHVKVDIVFNYNNVDLMWICQSFKQIYKISSIARGLSVSACARMCTCVCVTVIIMACILAKIKNVKIDVYIFWYLPANDAMGKVVLHEFLTYFFKIIYSNVRILKTMRASSKMRHTTFIYFDICHQMEPLLKSFFVILTYIFKVRI